MGGLALGLLGGGIIGFLIGVWHTTKDSEKALDAEKERLSRAEKEHRDAAERYKIFLDMEESRVSKDIEQNLEEFKKDGDKPKKNRKKEIDIPKASQKFKDEDFDEHFGDRDHPRDDGEEDVPVLIEPDDFRDFEGSTILLSYYQEDAVLTDGTGDKFVRYDPVSMLGEEIADLLTDTTEDTIYVRKGEDVYSVEVEHELSYYFDVLGLPQ